MALCLGSRQKEGTPTIEGNWDVYSLTSRVVYDEGRIESSEELGSFVKEMSFAFYKKCQGLLAFSGQDPLSGNVVAKEVGFSYETDGNTLRIEEGGYAHDADFDLENDTLIIDLRGVSLFRDFWAMGGNFTIKMSRE